MLPLQPPREAPLRWWVALGMESACPLKAFTAELIIPHPHQSPPHRGNMHMCAHTHARMCAHTDTHMHRNAHPSDDSEPPPIPRESPAPLPFPSPGLQTLPVTCQLTAEYPQLTLQCPLHIPLPSALLRGPRHFLGDHVPRENSFTARVARLCLEGGCGVPKHPFAPNGKRWLPPPPLYALSAL